MASAAYKCRQTQICNTRGVHQAAERQRTRRRQRHTNGICIKHTKHTHKAVMRASSSRDAGGRVGVGGRQMQANTHMIHTRLSCAHHAAARQRTRWRRRHTNPGKPKYDTHEAVMRAPSGGEAEDTSASAAHKWHLQQTHKGFTQLHKAAIRASSSRVAEDALASAACE